MRKTRAVLNNDVTTNFSSNGKRGISAATFRALLFDLIDSSFNLEEEELIGDGHVHNNLTQLSSYTRTQGELDNHITDQIAALIGSSPSALDTLNELAAALGDDPNFATTVLNSLKSKLDLIGGIITGELLFDKGVSSKVNIGSDGILIEDGLVNNTITSENISIRNSENHSLLSSEEMLIDDGINRSSVEPRYIISNLYINNPFELLDGPTINWDGYKQSVAVTLEGNRLMGNPTNKQSTLYMIMVRQDAVGGRTLIWDPNYIFPDGFDVRPQPNKGSVTLYHFLSDMGVFRFVAGGAYVAKNTSSELNSGIDDIKFTTAYALENSKYLSQTLSKISATTTNLGNAYAVTLSPQPISYPGLLIVKINASNTGASTLNPNGLGAKAITKNGNVAVVSNDLVINRMYLLAYDGTRYQIVGDLPNLSAKVDKTGSTLTGDLIFNNNGIDTPSNGTLNIGFSDTPKTINIGYYDGSGIINGDVVIGAKTIQAGVGINCSFYLNEAEKNISLHTSTAEFILNKQGLEETIFRDLGNKGRGIQYANSYAATFVNRSLVDKEYVDKHISPITTINIGNTYSLNLLPSVTEYPNLLVVKINANNTGPCTINPNSLGAKNITKNGSIPLAGGDLTANKIYLLVYDGTSYQIIGELGLSEKVSKSGDTMTNDLIVSSDGTLFGAVASGAVGAYDNAGNELFLTADGNFIQLTTNTGQSKLSWEPLTPGQLKNLVFPNKSGTFQLIEPLQTLADATTITWNSNLGRNAKVTLAGNRTLGAISNPQNGVLYSLIVIQDAIGSRTLSFSSTYKFPAGFDNTLNNTANQKTVFTFQYDGADFIYISGGKVIDLPSKVNKSGDTLTGDLIVNGTGIDTVGAGGTIKIGANNAANKTINIGFNNGAQAYGTTNLLGQTVNVGSGVGDSVNIRGQSLAFTSGTTTNMASQSVEITASTALKISSPGLEIDPANNSIKAKLNNFVITNYAALDFVNDAAAATGGVPLGGVYHKGGNVRIRLS